MLITPLHSEHVSLTQREVNGVYTIRDSVMPLKHNAHKKNAHKKHNMQFERFIPKEEFIPGLVLKNNLQKHTFKGSLTS